jgi:acyl carrier protein
MTDDTGNAAIIDRVVREALGLSGDRALDDLEYGRTPEWDSIAYLQMASGLEEALGIQLAADDVTQMTDYGSILTILRTNYGVQV